MPRAVDYTGRVVGRLLVVERLPERGKQTRYRCLCACGNETIVRSSSITSVHVKSCGCLHRETAGNRMRTHGCSGTPEHVTWSLMCARVRNDADKYYGGRGITICERWSSFENFLTDMGPRPGPEYSIDRVDNSQGYSPENCRWASRQEQANNKRNNRRFTYNGGEYTLPQLSRISGINAGTLRSRILDLGWDVARAVEESPQIQRK